MSEIVGWVIELAVKDGRLEDLRSLMSEMVEATKDNEPGALAYEWAVSDDGSIVHIHERYVDSDATLTHLKTFGENYAGRFLGCVKPTKLTVYGSPDERARKQLDQMGAIYMTPFGGFAR